MVSPSHTSHQLSLPPLPQEPSLVAVSRQTMVPPADLGVSNTAPSKKPRPKNTIRNKKPQVKLPSLTDSGQAAPLLSSLTLSTPAANRGFLPNYKRKTVKSTQQSSSMQPPAHTTGRMELMINSTSIQNEVTSTKRTKPLSSRPKLTHRKSSLLSGHWRRTLQEDSQTSAADNPIFCVQGASLLPNCTKPLERTVSEIQFATPIVRNLKQQFKISGRAYTMPVRSVSGADLDFDFNINGHNFQQPNLSHVPHSPILSPADPQLAKPLPQLVESPNVIQPSSVAEPLPQLVESPQLIQSYSPVAEPLPQLVGSPQLIQSSSPVAETLPQLVGSPQLIQSSSPVAETLPQLVGSPQLIQPSSVAEPLPQLVESPQLIQPSSVAEPLPQLVESPQLIQSSSSVAEPLPQLVGSPQLIQPSSVAEPFPQLVESPQLIQPSSPVSLSPSDSLPLIDHSPYRECPSPTESSPLFHLSPALSPPSLKTPAHLTHSLRPLLTESSFLKPQPPKQSIMYTKHLLNIHKQNSTADHDYIPFIGQAATVRTKVSSRIARSVSKSTLHHLPKKQGHTFLLPPPQAPNSRALPAIVGKTRKRKPLQKRQEKPKVKNPHPDLEVSGDKIETLNQMTDLISSAMEATISDMEKWLLQAAGKDMNPEELRLFKLKYGIVAEIDGPNGKIYLDENGMPVFPPGAMMQNSMICIPKLPTIRETSSPEDGETRTSRRARARKIKELLARYGGPGLANIDSMDIDLDGLDWDGEGPIPEEVLRQILLEQRLNKKGVKLYTEEEARKILELAKSDLRQMKQSSLTSSAEQRRRYERRKQRRKDRKHGKRGDRGRHRRRRGRRGDGSDDSYDSYYSGSSGEGSHRGGRRRGRRGDRRGGRRGDHRGDHRGGRRGKRKSRRRRRGENGSDYDSDDDYSDYSDSSDYDSDDYDSDDSSYDSDDSYYDDSSDDSYEYVTDEDAEEAEFESFDENESDDSEKYEYDEIEIEEIGSDGEIRIRIVRRRKLKKKKILRRKVETESATERRRAKRDKKRRERRNRRNGGISPDLDSTGQRMSSSRQRLLARKTTHMLSLSIADGDPHAVMTRLGEEELYGQQGRGGLLYRQGIRGQDSARMRAARFADRLSAMENGSGQFEDTEAGRKMTKEQRLKNIEAMMMDELAQDQLEVMKRRGMEKAAQVKAREEQQKREIEERERKKMTIARRAEENQRMQQMIDKLKKENDHRQFLHYIEQGILAKYMEEISQWEEVDFDYIEEYMGVEERKRLYSIDRRRKLREAYELEQNLVQTFELKRQELLMKLEQAHRQFVESLENESNAFSFRAQISRAFVTSYFRCVPAELQGLLSEHHDTL